MGNKTRDKVHPIPVIPEEEIIVPDKFTAKAPPKYPVDDVGPSTIKDGFATRQPLP